MDFNLTKDNVLKLLPANIDSLRKAFGIYVPKKSVNIIDAILRITPEPMTRKDEKLDVRLRRIISSLLQKGDIVQGDCEIFERVSVKHSERESV